MDAQRVMELLASYGADQRRWPVGEREAAARLIREDPALQRACQEEAALDALLDDVPLPSPSAALLARVVASAPGPVHDWRRMLWPFGPLWRPAMGLVAAGIMGMVVGAWTAPVPSLPDREMLVADVAFLAYGDGISLEEVP